MIITAKQNKLQDFNSKSKEKLKALQKSLDNFMKQADALDNETERLLNQLGVKDAMNSINRFNSQLQGI